MYNARVHFDRSIFTDSYSRSPNNNATEIAVRRGWHDTSFIYGPNLISVSDPPAMTAFEGSLPFRASSSVPLTGTALFIVTSHLCMNPRDSIVTYTWRTTLGGRECFVLSERKSAVAWMEVGLLGQSGNRWNGPARPCLSRDRAALPTTLESQITVFLVFLITRSIPKRFDGCLIRPFFYSSLALLIL